VWSLLIPGGGQFYNQQPEKGLAFLVTSVVGAYALIQASGNGRLFFDAHPSDDERSTIRSVAIGLIVGSYWGSLFDAVRSAR
jgi:hypothetical protein